MRNVFLICFLFVSVYLVAHEGHHEAAILAADNFSEKIKFTANEGQPTSWTQWIGSFHLILLHFPIALINMLIISECLQACFKKLIFEHTSQFLIVAAALLAPITALFGLVYSYSASYTGLMETFLYWHMWLGILTALLMVYVAFVRFKKGPSALYYCYLILLFMLINLTSFFGSGLTFGPYHLVPPY